VRAAHGEWWGGRDDVHHGGEHPECCGAGVVAQLVVQVGAHDRAFLAQLERRQAEVGGEGALIHRHRRPLTGKNAILAHESDIAILWSTTEGYVVRRFTTHR